MNDSIDPFTNHSNFTSSVIFPNKYLVIVSYSLLSLVALIGNSVVLFIILYFRALRTPTNLLISNLALADIMIAIFCLPFSYWPILILQYWPFGPFLCTFLSFMKAATVYLNAYTLVAISFDRFFAVVFPFKNSLHMSHRGALIVIGIVWGIAFLIAGPLLYLTSIRYYPEPQCEESWEDLGTKIYSHSIMVLQYFLPVTVLIVTYSAIVVNIWRTRVGSNKDHKQGLVQKSELRQRKDSVKKLIPMMILVTSLYALCWLPQNLFINVLLPLYTDGLTEDPHILYVWYAMHFTAMSHSIVNPFIYCARNNKFRNEVFGIEMETEKST